MKTRFLIFAIALLTLSVVFVGCDQVKQKKGDSSKVEFNPYVSAFTSGTISITKPIKLILSEDVKGVEYNIPFQKKFIKVSPNVEGDIVFLDGQNVEFRPKKNLQPGKSYKVTVMLSDVLDVEKKFEKFEFSFKTITPKFGYSVGGLDLYDEHVSDLYRLTGSIITTDYIEDGKVEGFLTASATNRQELVVKWNHGEGDNRHTFVIDSIKGQKKAYEVALDFNGKNIGFDLKKQERIQIPSNNDFTLIRVDVYNGENQYIHCQFSTALQANQDLRGLVRLTGSNRLTFKIELNNLYIYPQTKLMDKQTLELHEGIRNAKGTKLDEIIIREVVFESLKPAIRLVGKNNGGILPNSNGLTIPFQAVNVKAVNVQIIKVFENNVLQFLQVNKLDGRRELKRAGRLVKMETIKLGDENSPNVQVWNNYSLDLSKMIEPEPGAIYRVELGFKKSQAVYPCAEDSNESSRNLTTFEDEITSYDNAGNNTYYYDDYDSYGPSSYYNNPCENNYYYGKRTAVACNILASDVGMVARIGENKTIYAAVSNLVTAEPMGGVAVEVYNYQQQMMTKGTTDGSGMVEIPFTGKPYLLIAKNGKQRTYLRIDDPSSINLSNFDVSGDVIQKGIKGFIYGERGVWRPGDTIHISFILEDRDKVLPNNHPVNFELQDARGQVVQKITRIGNNHNFYVFSVATDIDAPTGNWAAEIKVGGRTFRKNLKVETVKPNRLKIELVLNEDPISSPDKISGTITSRWLHGAVARGLETEVNMVVSPMKTTFKGYEGYAFDALDHSFSTEEKEIFSGKLNDDGVVEFNTSYKLSRKVPGILKTVFKTRVYEEAGDFSVNEYTTKMYPYSTFVGIKEPQGVGAGNMLETDKDQEYRVVTLDAKGNPVDRKGVKIQVYKVNWSWWWSSSNGSSANYTQGKYNKIVYQTTVDTKNGEGSFKFKAGYSDWGRYSVTATDPGKHQAEVISYIDWPSWGGRPRQKDVDAVSQLAITPDKPKYNVGEKATISIPSAVGSRALVSIENGQKVLNAFWVEGKDEETKFTIDITRDMLPNVYAHITLVQPHAQTKNDLPIRMYGVVPIMVEDANTILKPIISMPDVLKPNEPFKLKISEANKREMTYTVAIVDEGLLDLTNFKTPNPWSTFFAREALGVRTWDVYDMVVGAFGGKIEQLFAIGGDDESLNREGGKEVNRFKPVVKFLGPFTLKKGTDEHTITLPNYVGSVRTMVVAGSGRAYGNTEKTTPVRKPLMVLATLPRVLGPGEEVDLPVNVFAMEDKIRNVNVKINPNSMFDVVGENSKDISFNTAGDQMVTFKLKVKGRVGVGSVKITASGAGEKAEEDIELNIRNANPKVHTTTEAIIKAGEEWSGSITLPGMIGTNEATLEVSTMPPLNLTSRLGYLLGFPHGCLEQTTSKAFPQLYLGKVMTLTSEQMQTAETNINYTLDKLKQFVTIEGGFGYWPGDRYPNLWASSYVGHFIVEAEKQGFSLPYGMKSSWIKFQKKEANNWTKENRKGGYYSYAQNDFDQAYRLYTLALANEPEMGAMNRLREIDNLSTQARWMLASAYALVGQTDAARMLVYSEDTDVKDYNGFSQSFGSRERDQAMIVDALTLLKEREKAYELVKTISKSLQSNKWMSTQTTAYCLMALSKFAASDGTNAREIKIEYLDNGRQKISSNMPIWQTQLKDLSSETRKLEMINKAGNEVYIRVVAEGIPMAGRETAAESGLRVTVRYLIDDEEIDPRSIQQGTNFGAEIKVYNPGLQGDYKNMALTQIFPSGWEIINSRLNDSEYSSESTYDYRDIRDDRVYTYFSLNTRETKTFKVNLNAAYKGRFYMPAVSCNAMYDGTISANNVGQWVHVTE